MNIKKYLLIIIFSTISANYCFSQINYDKILFQPDSIPQDTLPEFEIVPIPKSKLQHPYLFFSKEDISELKIRVDNPELYNQWQQLKKDALSPENHWDLISYAILPGCIAYQITGDTSYAHASIRKLMSLIHCNHPWDVPSPLTPKIQYLNWEIGDKVLAIAYAYDMLFDVLTTEQKDDCIKALEEKVYPAFISAHSYHYKDKKIFVDENGHSDWWTSCYFNWNSHINGTVGLVALATLWDSKQSPMIIQMARSSLKYTFPEFNQGEDECGGFDVGTTSLSVHLADLIKFYYSFKRVYNSDDGFFELPGIEKSLQFYTDFIAPDDYFVPFGATNHWEVKWSMDELYYLGNIYKNYGIVSFLDNHTLYNASLPFALMWRPILNDTILPEEKDHIKFYKDIQWGFFNDDKMYIPFKAGDNAANDSQQDVGNMLIWYDKEYILHSYSTNHSHLKYDNCLLINGEGQIAGNPRERDFGLRSKHFATIDKCTKIDENYYTRMNLNSCYKNVKKYDRHIILAEHGFVIVIDDIITDTASTFTQNWNTILNLDIENDSIFQIYKDYKGVNIQSKCNIPIKHNIVDSSDVKQLQFITSSPSKQAIIITLFAPFSLKSLWLDFNLEQNKMIITTHYKNKSRKYLFDIKDNHYEFTKVCYREDDCE